MRPKIKHLDLEYVARRLKLLGLISIKSITITMKAEEIKHDPYLCRWGVSWGLTLAKHVIVKVICSDTTSAKSVEEILRRTQEQAVKEAYGENGEKTCNVQFRME